MYSEGKFNVQWNLSIVDTIGTQLDVLYTVEPLYNEHHWDPAGCPVYMEFIALYQVRDGERRRGGRREGGKAERRGG